jgi:hypothetical protein
LSTELVKVRNVDDDENVEGLDPGSLQSTGAAAPDDGAAELHDSRTEESTDEQSVDINLQPQAVKILLSFPNFLEVTVAVGFNSLIISRFREYY